MKIIQVRERVETVDFTLFFESKTTRGFGFAFACEENGTLKPFENDAQPKSYERVTSGDEFKTPVVRIHRHAYTIPAVGLCGCGRKVELEHFTNTCECGIDYNFAGQQLAPRSQWGEETGEHWSDCY
jgi:hypothetical protein